MQGYFQDGLKHGKFKLELKDEKGWFEGEYNYNIEKTSLSKYSKRI